jgi:uncharacterized lipoprotein YddW (UPF0748 family)
MIPRNVVILAATLAVAANAQPLEEMRAVKLTDVASQVLYTDENIAEAMDYLASIGVNAVFPAVWNASMTQFPSEVMDSLTGVPIDPQFSGRDPLGRVVVEAHRVGIEVYPWFEYGFAAWYSNADPPTLGPLLTVRPDLASRDLDGSITVKDGFVWMSGVNPEVRGLLLKLVEEVVHNYEVDGVEFSDRIPALPIQGGYDSVSVAIYRSEHAGADPPTNGADPSWMRWRANKLNLFYKDAQSLVEGVDENIVVASSPSVYPWSYENYLQDAQTWLDSSLVDHFIPQLYRYNYADYQYELNQAIAQAGAKSDEILFAGILMNVGSYVVSESLLLDFMQLNRDRNVPGEAFFFYEGLRKNDDALGSAVYDAYYKTPAIVPMRGGSDWRPPALVVNETDSSALASGGWIVTNVPGFEGKILRAADTGFASIDYRFDVPTTAWYDAYVHTATSSAWTDVAAYQLLGATDTVETTLDQTDAANKGWRKLGEVYLEAGERTAIRLTNDGVASGNFVVADAAMLMVNRRRSPDAVFVAVEEDVASRSRVIPDSFTLRQNYPNPFNPVTSVRMELPEASEIRVEVYDALGRKAATLAEGAYGAGVHVFRWNAADYPSGAYFCRAEANGGVASIKMLLLK